MGLLAEGEWADPIAVQANRLPCAVQVLPPLETNVAAIVADEVGRPRRSGGTETPDRTFLLPQDGII
jgi:hypothetical protein